MTWRTWLLAAASTWLLACGGSKPPPAPVDSGTEEVPFEGDATGNLPDFSQGLFDAGTNSTIDAGPVELDRRCCWLPFALDNRGEPADAVAVVRGSVEPLASGVSLRATDAGFVAHACFPVNTSSYYWYELRWRTNDPDAGGVALEDGGYEVSIERFSEAERHFDVGGVTQNFIPAVETCDLLDAGTGP